MEYSELNMKILWLAMTVNSEKFFQLLDYYEQADFIWENYNSKDPNLNFLSDKTKSALDKTKNLSYVNNCIEKWKRPKFITVFENDYPKLLKETAFPPVILFYEGNIHPFDKYIGMVGMRNCTAYGTKCAKELSRGLAENGVTIVSGGARGIDTSAHMGAMEGGGRTVCVLGCGIDVVYPAENERLFYDICDTGGAIITEFMPGERPNPWNFPQRNRIISGMSSGVVIVEAGEKSGALITADIAANEGRDVFSVPGNMDSPNSVGTNKLIKNGACLVTSYEDILNEYGWKLGCERKADDDAFKGLDDDEKAVVRAIMDNRNINTDELCVITGMDIVQLNSTVTMLEISGVVKRLPGNILTI